jgi:flagellar assembly protein FliH
MRTVEVNIPKSINRVKIIHSRDIVTIKSDSTIPVLESRNIDDDELIENNLHYNDIDDAFFSKVLEEFGEKQDNINEDISESIANKNIKQETLFYQQFKFSNADKLCQIDLKKIQDNNLLFKEINNQVQSSYKQGLEFGKEVTATTFNKEIVSLQEWLKQFDSVAEDMRIQFSQLFGRIENSVSDLAIMIAEHILEHEVSQNSHLFIEQTRKAIASIDNEIIIKIRLHPENVDILKKVKSSLLEDSTKLENVTIVPDTSIDKMGCIVETNVGIIDARISTQLDKLKESLENIIQSNE